MVGTTGNAACSIALRNAIFRGIPKAFWNDIYEDAKKVAKGNVKSLATNRGAALDWLARKGVTKEVVLAALGLKGVEDIGLDELVTLKGMMTAVKDGESTVEEIFAVKDAPEGKPKTAEPKEKVAADNAQQPAAAATAKSAATKGTDDVITLDQATVIADKLKEEGVELSLFLASFSMDQSRNCLRHASLMR